MYNETLYNGSSFYGNFRTRTFSDIFSKSGEFSKAWQELPFAQKVEELPIDLIYYLLYSRYGNSSIANSDENQFKFQIFATIFQYAPTWNKELTVQQEIRMLTEGELLTGSTNILNNASNPSTKPTNQTSTELPFINNQNVNKTIRSKVDGYALLLSLLKDDVTETFLKRFEKLFLTIVQPEKPLWYVTEED